jgi:hypothetical protein
VDLQEIVLPKFSRSCGVDNQHAFVFAGKCNYYIIFGRNFLRKIGMKHDFNIGSMTAFDITIPMKQRNFYNDPLLALANTQDNNDNGCFHSTQILQNLSMIKPTLTACRITTRTLEYHTTTTTTANNIGSTK